ncbi:GNAT family N-acetyltransferase [Glaciihabitans arcticus]|uniref:GNAT family N-acetyltransferase n=1 Tax=Glaciihabitans arcticus TaxID=2668039 RepID=A0A4Q9GUK0_9MICO|nr:GNAT family N-acetyltransferase [Glaciihabitans arcticus]TBN57884.1 GNAT family N-acetyltransferase [Glaciihabitans arcticus]
MSRVIRPAEIRDAPALGRVHVECWRESYGHFLSPGFLAELDPVARGERWIRTLGEPRADDRVAVLEVDGELRGFAMSGATVDEDAPRAHQVYAIYQYATEHGSGSGAELLDAVIGDEPASLWVAELNPRAHSFYRRNGFDFDGTRKVEPSWEDLVELRMIR